jgi:hypothetical protein
VQAYDRPDSVVEPHSLRKEGGAHALGKPRSPPAAAVALARADLPRVPARGMQVTPLPCRAFRRLTHAKEKPRR